MIDDFILSNLINETFYVDLELILYSFDFT